MLSVKIPANGFALAQWANFSRGQISLRLLNELTSLAVKFSLRLLNELTSLAVKFPLLNELTPSPGGQVSGMLRAGLDIFFLLSPGVITVSKQWKESCLDLGVGSQLHAFC